MPPRKRQLNVGLTDEEREQLEKAAARMGRTLANEIRHRLQQTFQDEREFDAVTRMLGRDIMRLASEVDLTSGGTSGGRWYDHAEAHAAVAAAIAQWLELIKPLYSRGEPMFDEISPGHGLGDPETLGRTVARLRFFKQRDDIAYHIEQEKKRREQGINQEKADKAAKRPHQKEDKT